MRKTVRNLMFPTDATTRLALALFILRVFVGIAFIQHGSGKLMHPSEFAAEFGIPIWLALTTMLTQLIGGMLLVLGALTPLAALGIAGTMIKERNRNVQRTVSPCAVRHLLLPWEIVFSNYPT
jgi:hypothetical protein